MVKRLKTKEVMYCVSCGVFMDKTYISQIVDDIVGQSKSNK